jgi:hypothetical protein
MSEDKKGRLKVTLEVEVNEQLVEVMKDAVSNMNWRMPEILKRRGEEKK